MTVVTARPRNGRTRGGWSVGVWTVLCVLLVVIAVSAFAVLVAPGQGSAASPSLRDQPGALPWNGRTPLTALLIGTDGASPNTASSLIVAQYRPITDSLSLLAVPGNLWVSIPGFGQAPIAHAFADGGVRLALVSVQSVLHLPIPYYATIDPGTARQLIDAVGTLRVPETNTSGALVMRELDGARALSFTGIAPIDDGANRSRRELATLIAAQSQAFGSSALLPLAALVSRFGGALTTNIPYSALPGLTEHLGRLQASNIHAAALDLANGSLRQYTSNGVAMVLPDPAGAPALARTLLAVAPIRAPGGVTVLNGAGITGQAAALATWLGQAGVPISSSGTADSAAYAHTVVLISPRASSADRQAAQTISTLLQVPVTSGYVPRQQARVTVIIGSDYQDPTQR